MAPRGSEQQRGEPAVTVLMVVRNEAANLGRALEALFAQEGVGPLQVVVVDSGSTDGTPAIARSYPVELVEIPSEEFGHGRSRNLAARHARAPVLAFLGGDSLPASRHWLRELVTPLSNPRVAAVYGRQLPQAWANPMEVYFLNTRYPERSRVQRAGPRPTMDAGWFSTVNAALRREVWEALPFADVPVAEDSQWAVRVLRAGWDLAYASEAAVYHTHNYTLGAAWRRYYRLGQMGTRSYLAGERFGPLALAGRGARYLLGECGHLLARGQGRWIPYALLYEGVKGAALMAGAGCHALRRLGG